MVLAITLGLFQQTLGFAGWSAPLATAALGALVVYLLAHLVAPLGPFLRRTLLWDK